MLEQEMSLELSLGARKMIFAGLLVGILAFACAVYFIGQPKIALIILGVAVVFAVVGAFSLKGQSAKEERKNTDGLVE